MIYIYNILYIIYLISFITFSEPSLNPPAPFEVHLRSMPQRGGQGPLRHATKPDRDGWYRNTQKYNLGWKSGPKPDPIFDQTRDGNLDPNRFPCLLNVGCSSWRDWITSFCKSLKNIGIPSLTLVTSFTTLVNTGSNCRFNLG